VPTFHLDELASSCGGRVKGQGTASISTLAPIGRAAEGSISFLDHPRWLGEISKCKATAVIVEPAWVDHAALADKCLLVHAQPHRAVLIIARMLTAQNDRCTSIRIHATAIVHPSATTGAGVRIGPYAVVGRNARLGNFSQLGPCCHVGDDVSIGANTRIDANVIIYEGCVIGENCALHSGAVIGASGFLVDRFERGWERMPAIGAVFVGNDVEIGANTTVDRGVVDDTTLGNGVKLDNLIQIGHDVHIGERCVIAAGTGIAGGTTIGCDSKISGQVGIAGNLSITSGVHLLGSTAVSKSIHRAGAYSGFVPFAEYAVWKKNFSLIRKLAQLRERIAKLERSSRAS
jgi:UDP-3-O-[3-hydroxymyristoyl] glucosamine N-acyltransferase